MKSSVRRGFTLVELLIVILVIGVLSMMMILSSTEAVTTAKATKIISDMNQLKRAALAWYLDNYQRIAIKMNGTKSDGFYVDGKKFHELLNGKGAEITKYLSSTNVALNSKTANYSSNEQNEYGAEVGYYALYMGNGNTVCYVVYRISQNNNAAEETKLKEKLQARASSAGLLKYRFGNRDSNNKSTSKTSLYDGADANVFMKVFELEE